MPLVLMGYLPPRRTAPLAAGQSYHRALALQVSHEHGQAHTYSSAIVQEMSRDALPDERYPQLNS
eukprot:157140-Pleurochrysis_carterae.AAC.2